MVVRAREAPHAGPRCLCALGSLGVFARQRGRPQEGGYCLTLGDEVFLIKDWWGREDDFRPIAAKFNRAKLAELSGFAPLFG